MSKQRLEAFTDGVIAIAITIMVLDLKVPPGTTFASLASDIPVLLAYTLSFANVGIFWNNHHHMLHATERINGMVLWANLFLLFWISLVPFAIRWVDDTHFAAAPTATYGAGYVRGRVHPSRTIHHRLQRSAVETGASCRQRPEKQSVAADLCAGNPPRLRAPLDRVAALCGGRGRLVHA
jgi:uncharacterized membrane protein